MIKTGGAFYQKVKRKAIYFCVEELGTSRWPIINRTDYSLLTNALILLLFMKMEVD